VLWDKVDEWVFGLAWQAMIAVPMVIY